MALVNATLRPLALASTFCVYFLFFFFFFKNHTFSGMLLSLTANVIFIDCPDATDLENIQTLNQTNPHICKHRRLSGERSGSQRKCRNIAGTETNKRRSQHQSNTEEYKHNDAGVLLSFTNNLLQLNSIPSLLPGVFTGDVPGGSRVSIRTGQEGLPVI